MTEKKGGKFTRIFNPETQGAVMPETDWRQRVVTQVQSMRDRAEEEHPGAHLAEVDTTDRYSGRGRFEDGEEVSIESADAWQEGQSDFANGEEMTGRKGTLPCDMTGRERDSKTGKSGKRTWDR